MKINLHVDASISEEHAEIWVKQMKPNLESMLQYLNNNQVLWCYYDGAIDVVLTNQERIAISRRKIKNLKERLGL